MKTHHSLRSLGERSWREPLSGLCELDCQAGPPSISNSAGRPARTIASFAGVVLGLAMLLASGDFVRAVPGPRPAPKAGTIRFAVLSDTHFYDTHLGTTGTAFDNYLAADPKLLTLSEPILASAIADLINRQVRFVVITGDLTKDGEVFNHVRVAQHLQELRKAGIGVYVIPGNHDINNADALEYRPNGPKPVPTASPAVFRALYERFGYGQAIARAPDSLSYVAEPVPGLWLLALDSAKWAESATAPHPIVSGRLSPATLAWALGQLQAGQARGKRVIGFMHHGVNLHFLAEPAVFGDYLVDNWPMVGAQFAAAGLKVIFTGHYHSQDASACTANAQGEIVGSTLCDIETGSLVTYPCAYRLAELNSAGVLHVTSQRVTQIAANLDGVPFPQYAESFQRALLPYQVIAELEQLFGLPETQAAAVAPWVVDGLMANMAGDENPDADTQALLSWLDASPEPMHTLGVLLSTLWYDLPPGDNTLDVPVS